MKYISNCYISNLGGKTAVDNQNSELPDLDYYLGERRRNIVTYEDGAKIMKNPFYSFVRIAKEAKANYLAKKQVL